MSANNTTGSASQPSTSTPVIAPYPPANTAPPTVVGTVKRGYALTASQGAWTGPGNTYTYQWQEDFGEGYTAIAGATSPTYTLTAADEGDPVRVVITATNPDGTIVAGSQPTVAVTPDTPVNDVAPTLSGSAQRGSVITAGPGTWEGQNDTYSFQWQHSTDNGVTWSNVAGQTGSSYAIGVSDEGSRLRAVVTATNPDGAVSQASAATSNIAALPPVATAAPTVGGSAQRGQTLSSTNGTWSGLGNVYALQWQRSANGTTWANIASATSPTYALTTADEGDVIRLQVTAINPDATVTASSTATATVAAAPPVNTAAPQLSGIAQRSASLSVNAGAWNGIGNGYAVQWQRSPTAGRRGQTSPARPPGPTRSRCPTRAHELRVRITATNADGSASATSAAVRRSAPRRRSTPRCRRSRASPCEASALSSVAGTWTGIGNTLRPTSGSVGQTAPPGRTSPAPPAVGLHARGHRRGRCVRLEVTATNPDGVVTAASAPTATWLIAAGQHHCPAITGTPQRGMTLSAGQGTWSGPATATPTNGSAPPTAAPGATSPARRPPATGRPSPTRARPCA